MTRFVPILSYYNESFGFRKLLIREMFMSIKPFFRNLLIAFVAIASLVGTPPALAQGGAAVRVDPASQSATVNGTVNVAIKVDNISGLTAVELHFSFNPSVLEVTSMTNGGFVAADFSAQNVFNNTTGTIDYAIAQMNRTPATGSGTLLNITFKAKANGTSNITLNPTPAVPSGMLLSDQNGTSLPASFTNGTITVGTGVNPTTAVPPTATNTATLAPGVTPPTATITSTPQPGAASATPTKTATPTVTSAGAAPVVGAKVGTHKVAAGETLYCIGRAYKVTPWSIAEANNLWWPYTIYPGQILSIIYDPWTSIPSGPTCTPQFTISSSSTTPVPTAVVTSAPSQTCRAYYTVISGDTLYTIGLAYGVSYSQIAQVNQIPNPQLIYPGQVLCIP